MDKDKNFDFEKTLKEVEKIVSDIENNKISINEVLEKYNQGKDLLNTLNKYLEDIEKKVNQVEDKD